MKNSFFQWIPSLSLSLMAFIFVTTEYVPVGLIGYMASDLGKTEQAIGLLMTIYAWIVSLMSLPMTVWTSHYNRRKLILSLLTIFSLANLFSALASNYELLLLSRVLIALSHSVFWSIAPPLAMMLAPEGKSNSALAIVITGGSLGNVLGIPLGTLIGHTLGWRTTFFVIASLSAIILITAYKVLPDVKMFNSARFKDLSVLLKKPIISFTYILTILFITANFTTFTYISPLLQKVGHYSYDDVIFILILVGLSGILGSYLANKYIKKYPAQLITYSLLLAAVSLYLLSLFIEVTSLVYALCFMWGLVWIVATFVFQSKIIENSQGLSDMAVSIYSGLYNVGIGAGALVGGMVSYSYGYEKLTHVSIFILCFSILFFNFKKSKVF